MHSTQTVSVVPASEAWFARFLRTVRALLLSVRVRRGERSLRICETLPLGEKRLLAVVQFEGRRFLIGATNQSICLLDRLDSSSTPRQKRDRSGETSFLTGVH